MTTDRASRSPAAPTSTHEVLSPLELAQAAGVDPRVVRHLITTADIPTVDGEFVAYADALTAVRDIRLERLQADPDRFPPGVFGGTLASASGTDLRTGGASVAVSTAIHASAILLVVFVTTATLTTAATDIELRRPPELAQMIFVAEPGPGGGGGGGGLRMPTPSKAERAGTRDISSPLPERLEPEKLEPLDKPPEPPTLDNESLPPIFAPLASARADREDLRGLLVEPPDGVEDSHGPGIDGGVGDGSGFGIGEGSGRGVGEGSGGGTGGGPYRPGSGIVAPRLLHEERPVYTEEARRQGIEGDVLIELVVRRDGTVGNVQLLRRIGYGLDERALQAVQQWRFAPAERFGEPVDVLVEVAVEFRLR